MIAFNLESGDDTYTLINRSESMPGLIMVNLDANEYGRTTDLLTPYDAVRVIDALFDILNEMVGESHDGGNSDHSDQRREAGKAAAKAIDGSDWITLEQGPS